MQKITLQRETGSVTPTLLVILSVFFVFATSVLSWSLTERRNVMRAERETEALQLAEAGVDYYRWHLAHDEADFTDGEDWCCDNASGSTPESCGAESCGPYIRPYTDYSGQVIGQYELTITPPAVGATVLTVRSTGRLSADPTVAKTVTARLGKRSLATYSLLGNSPIWIGDTEATSGPLHSNKGVRFDGTCDAEVTSAVEEYDTAAAHHGSNGTQPGIWGSADADCQQYWSFPEPAIDFDLFTLDMTKIRTAAQDGGIYLAPSGKSGYRLQFKSDGTVDIIRVDAVRTGDVTYVNDQGVWAADSEQIKTPKLLRNEVLPANGVIFVEDDVWVDGVVNGRVTVAASRLTSTPSRYATILINGNLQYSARDGGDVLGLMAEGDIIIPKHAPNNLIVDAVMLSQNGHVYRRQYDRNDRRSSIEVYGGIITNLNWTWSYVDQWGNVTHGYESTSSIYDTHLTYSPPPLFPTTENFEVISWHEDD